MITAPDSEFRVMPMADAVNLRQTICMLIVASPMTRKPIIQRPGLTLRYSPDEPVDVNTVFLEVGDDPYKLRVLTLAAQDWIPWADGKWTAPPVYGLRGEHSTTSVFRKPRGDA